MEVLAAAFRLTERFSLSISEYLRMLGFGDRWMPRVEALLSMKWSIFRRRPIPVYSCSVMVRNPPEEAVLRDCDMGLRFIYYSCLQ